VNYRFYLLDQDGHIEATETFFALEMMPRRRKQLIWFMMLATTYLKAMSCGAQENPSPEAGIAPMLRAGSDFRKSFLCVKRTFLSWRADSSHHLLA
jgi:hypothetical protein